MRHILGKDVFDSLEELLNPIHCALLVVDMQNDFCIPTGHFAHHGRDIGFVQKIITPLSTLVSNARDCSILVVFILTTTLPDGRSDSPAWLYLKTRDGKSPDYCIPGTKGHDLVDGLTPINGELVITKHRSSAFTGTDLDMLLHVNQIKTLVVTGTSTEGCVNSTARDASVHDYYVVLANDCIASYEKRIHDAAMVVLKSRFNVVSSTHIARIWRNNKIKMTQ